jgi:hypothetical protein
MITALLVLALLLTLMIAAVLPFGGFGSSADAAGRGMAMFFPAILMTVRAGCVVAALFLVIWSGGFAWTGIGSTGATAAGLGIVAISGAMSFHSAAQLTTDPAEDGRGTYAFLASILTPVALALSLLAEAYRVEPLQSGIALAVVMLALVSSAAFMQRDVRNEIIAVAAERARQDKDEQDALIIASCLPPDATLLELLRQLERLPETMWRARELVEKRISMRPDLRPEMMALLDGTDWTARISAGRHASRMSFEPSPDYFKAVKPTLDEIVRRLENDVAGHDILVNEAQAAIGLAWPAMHNDGMPKALLMRLAAAIEAHSGDSRFAELVYSARMLADSNTG